LLRKLCIQSGSLPDSLEISEENITRHHDHAIDGGGFADIWLGTYGRITVALKVFRVFSKDDAQVVYKKFCKEAIQWKRLCHPNITPFMGVNTTLFPLCLGSEWMPNGSVNVFLKKRPNANRLELASHRDTPLPLVDVAKGLEYLHAHGLFHGDLKGANVLVDETSHARLSDFGLAAVIYDPDTVNLMTTSSCDHGSIRWMAPELLFPEQVGLKSARQTFQSDVYSLAMVMWEIFTGRMPFHEIPRDPAVVYQVTMLGTRPKRPPDALLLGLSDAVWRLMELCWRTDWRERPMMAFILQQLAKAIEDYLPVNRDVETTERLWENRLHDSSSTRVSSIMRHSYDTVSLPTGLMSKTASDNVTSACSNANDPGSSWIRNDEENLEHIRDAAQLFIGTERKYVHGLEILQVNFLEHTLSLTSHSSTCYAGLFQRSVPYGRRDPAL
ncbi:kinase-like protein, partial [Laetiporus sulphureus 93-53]